MHTDKLSRLADRAADTLSAFDDLPFSPSSLGATLVSAHGDRRTRRAASDPTWSTIEARRQTDDGLGTVFLSDDLTLADWNLQGEIAERITPDPFWLAAAHALKELRFGVLLRRAKDTVHRARHGWAARDTWSLGTTNAKRLGEQLLWLAENTNSFPGTDEFPTPEAWEAALRLHGTMLRDRSDASAEYEAANQVWYDLEVDPDSDPDVVEAARLERDRIERDDHAAAKESLHWFADHYLYLWD